MNTQPLVSFLVSTHNRANMVLNLLRSIASTASENAKYEVILRVTYDDRETLRIARSFYNICVFRMLVSWPLDGYDSVPYFVQEMSRLACGKWSWLVGDDCEFRGGDWHYHMQNLPLDSCTVSPEWTVLNTSGYQNVPRGPFPCIPTWWLRENVEKLGSPLDASIGQLADAHKLRPMFLPDVQLIHHNPTQGERDRERANEKEEQSMLRYKRPDFAMSERMPWKSEEPMFPPPSPRQIIKQYNPHDRSSGRVNQSPAMRIRQ